MRQRQYIQAQSSALSVQRFLMLSLLLLATVFLMLPTTAQSQSGEVKLQQDLKMHLTVLDGLIVDNDTPARAQNPLPDQAFDSRVTVVAFFASWCPPCLHEFKALNEIHRQVGAENITIIAVNVFEKFDDNDDARMVNFLQTTTPEFSVLKGSAQSRKLFGNVNRIPTLLVFDKSGDLAFNFIHAQGAKKQSVDSKELMDKISPLL